MIRPRASQQLGMSFEVSVTKIATHNAEVSPLPSESSIHTSTSLFARETQERSSSMLDTSTFCSALAVPLWILIPSAMRYKLLQSGCSDVIREHGTALHADRKLALALL